MNSNEVIKNIKKISVEMQKFEKTKRNKSLSYKNRFEPNKDAHKVRSRTIKKDTEKKLKRNHKMREQVSKPKQDAVDQQSSEQSTIEELSMNPVKFGNTDENSISYFNSRKAPTLERNL
mmetsp:Transcript_31751/g.28121  ORF Transcript_31751/g.28121 Transcript_31751/m.28121 type:complete len:119 (+) Transcript_31751:305-661(+)